MWKGVLGATSDPHLVRLSDWERFIELRTLGAIDPRGREVSPKKRRPVRNRSVEADCNWLRWVFSCASKWRMRSGHYLMRENPVRGFEAPKEKNPSRPVATQDRFEAVRAKADQVLMETRWGRRVEQRSYLSELLDIVNGTGRRISAVCRLTYEDLKTDLGPHGSIRWPAATDKMGRETLVPISPDVDRALERCLRERPGSGSAPLFPSPEDAHEPMSRHLRMRGSERPRSWRSLNRKRGASGTLTGVSGPPSGSTCRM